MNPGLKTDAVPPVDWEGPRMYLRGLALPVAVELKTAMRLLSERKISPVELAITSWTVLTAVPVPTVKDRVGGPLREMAEYSLMLEPARTYTFPAPSSET
jgi:hypothetical protein